MEVLLLGDVAVAGETGLCRVDAPLARRCLGAMALSSGPISLDRLADALWDDRVPANWKPALRNVVAKLRSRLGGIGGGGDRVIATTATGYQLAASCSVDVFRALGDADAADEALDDGDPDAALGSVATALELLDKDLLAEIDAHWLVGYRTRLAWARSRALQVGAAASRSAGRPAHAVDYATRAVLADPLAEESHRQLMHAHIAAGDRAAALKAFESCRRTLADELGVSPDPETMNLHLRLLGTESPVPARPRTAGPFLGRERELAMLDASVVDGALVSIVGPGGIGKSRLAAAFVAEAAGRYDGAPIVLDVDGQSRGGDLTTTVATAFGVAAGTDADVRAAVLRTAATRGRSLLVFDGVDHAADEAARLIVAFMESCPAVAIVVTCRVPLGLDDEVVVRPQPLDPVLDGHECFVAYATAAGGNVGTGAATRAAIADVCRAVGGIPLGIELAARQTAEISLADLVDRLTTTTIDDEGRPLEMAASVVESTIALLDDVELEVFRRLAVLGGPADLTLVEAAVADHRVPARRVVRVLAQLADRALVRLDRSTVRWRYDQHPVLRAAAMAALTDDDRRGAYARLATALFARLPPSPSEQPRVADVDPVLPAVRSFLAAALDGDADSGTALRMAYWLHRYWSARAIEEGIRWTTQLLAVASDDDPNRGASEFGLGYLLLWSGRTDIGTKHLLTATSLLDRHDPLLARAHYFIGNAAENRQPDVARRHLALAIDAAAAAGDTGLVSRLGLGLAGLEFEAGERAGALERYRTVMADLEALGDTEQLAIHLPQYASMLISVARFDEAHRVLQRVDELLGDDVRISSMLSAAHRARLERHRNHLPAARRHALRAAAMVDQVGVGRLDGVVSPTIALLDLADGDSAAAVGELARGAKAANASDFVSLFAEIVDAAVLVAASTDHVPVAIALRRSADEIRVAAQVQRGEPEQAELDAALSGIDDAEAPSDAPELDRSRIADLIASLAAD